jgi:hypothetical protein
MATGKIPVTKVNQICVEIRPSGVRAVYLVETQNEHQAAELSKFFNEFESVLQVVPLSTGKLVSYAVQLHAHDQSLLEEIETFLKKNFGFVILHRSFDSMIYDIVKELCKDSGSQLLPIPKCNMCGKSDPFPETVISLMTKEKCEVATRAYCSNCTVGLSRSSNKEFVKALLEADRGELRMLSNMGLVRSRSSNKQIAFRLKWDVEQQFAAT